MALQNLINGLGKLVPESQKAEYNKDAAAAMKHMNALTGGPGGKSQGIAGSGSGGKEKIGDPTKKQYKQVVTKGVDKDGFSYTETKRVEITPEKTPEKTGPKDVATSNVRLTQVDDADLSDEAIEVLERSQTKDTTKIPALLK